MYKLPVYEVRAGSNERFGERYYSRVEMYPGICLLENDVGACN